MQRLADEKAKKKAASKRQEELEQQKKKMEEEAKKKIQQAVSQCFDLCRDLPPLAAVCCTHLFPVFCTLGRREAPAGVAGQEEGRGGGTAGS